MLYETHILDFNPPENGRIKFQASIKDIIRGINAIAHLDFPIEQRIKAKTIDGVSRAVKTWFIPKKAVTKSIAQTIGSKDPVFSVIQKICNILNDED